MKLGKELTAEEIGKRMDELARRYAETHDENFKAELEVLSHRLAELLWPDKKNSWLQ